MDNKALHSGWEEAQIEKVRHRSWVYRLLLSGIETRGTLPVALEDRTDPQFSKAFFIWLSANSNILSFSAGTLGPLFYGLGLRDSCLVILFFNLLCVSFPAYLATFGPKMGMRQMVHARYTYGYWPIAVPCILALASMMGFNILSAILGGQTLASVSDGSVSWTVGIVIVSVLTLALSFCGYKVLHFYERYAWMPVWIVYLVVIGIGAKSIAAPPPTEPATAGGVLTFGATIAGFVISFCGMMSDYTAYMKPEVPSWKVFTYTYIGLFLPIVIIQILGAAFAIGMGNVPEWQDAYNTNSVGGLLEAVLRPAGNFGKFLTVLLALSVTANTAPTIYSFCLIFQVFIPPARYVPRYVFSILGFAIMLALAIVGAHSFYETLSNFLGLIGYWSASFCSAIITEHLLFRHNDFANYDASVWDTPSRLPSGIPALAAGILSFALVIPSMNEVWFIGPIAQAIPGYGDIGFELALVVTMLLYIPFRWIEIRFRGLH
ncbi:cytosine-purine permease [Dacryopinax primogenitus]|uniref:Cytosine-purine permease n=1 Tax=Dacryopinax primogenitus (strain DJM 731) TaxID=1858805 RepID=M5FTS4_DACPD|nr:cytosine-purine permease [Dacryopinax primogenitus]EJU01056.1 cytosine-purine permease [Dacryopinax primogenitus]